MPGLAAQASLRTRTRECVAGTHAEHAHARAHVPHNHTIWLCSAVFIRPYLSVGKEGVHPGQPPTYRKLPRSQGPVISLRSVEVC